MEEDVVKLFLGEMSLIQFLFYFGVASLGSITSFAYSVITAIKTNSKTSNAFQWKFFWVGFVRSIISLIFLALAVAEWEKVSSLLFESETSVELTVWSSFILGLSVERLSEVLIGSSKKVAKRTKITALWL